MTNPRRRLLECACQMVLAASLTACWSGTEVRDCPLGEQDVDGQCVPTSTLVFERCVSSFRKTSSVDEQSEGTEVQVQVPGGYGGAVGQSERDRTRESYATLPEGILPEAIEECRRQEQVEREGQLARARVRMNEAIAAAHQAEAERAQAEQSLGSVETDLENARAAYEELEEAKDALGVEMEEVRKVLREREQLLSRVAPCEVEDWAACSEAALAAKRAGDYAAAHAKYALSCGEVAPEACTNWGVMFEHGLGVDVSIDAAINKHELGCDGKKAQNRLLPRW